MAADKRCFTVMTMNLRFGLADDGDNAWQKRKHLCARIFQRYPVDFLGVQESNHFQTEFLIRRLDNHQSVGWHNRDNPRWQSNLIFYHKKWECLKHQHYFLSSTPSIESKLPGSRWPRQCVIALFRNASFKVIVVNTHFDFDDAVQEKSAGLVLQNLGQFPEEASVVIVGDFNANPGSRTHHLFQEGGFRDVFENHHATTFHQFGGQNTRRHIDWILYRGQLHVRRKNIITDSFHGRYPSDHYPVMAGFSTTG